MAMARAPQTLQGFGVWAQKTDNDPQKDTSSGVTFGSEMTKSSQNRKGIAGPNIAYNNKEKLSAENIKEKYNKSSNLKNNNSSNNNSSTV